MEVPWSAKVSRIDWVLDASATLGSLTFSAPMGPSNSGRLAARKLSHHFLDLIEMLSWTGRCQRTFGSDGCGGLWLIQSQNRIESIGPNGYLWAQVVLSWAITRGLSIDMFNSTVLCTKSNRTSTFHQASSSSLGAKLHYRRRSMFIDRPKFGPLDKLLIYPNQ